MIRILTALPTAAALCIAAPTTLVGQSATNADATATITIVSGITLTHLASMDFGQAVQGTAGDVFSTTAARWSTDHDVNAAVQVSLVIPSTMDEVGGNAVIGFSCSSTSGEYVRGNNPTVLFDPATGFTSDGANEPGIAMNISLGDPDIGSCTASLTGNEPAGTYSATITITATII